MKTRSSATLRRNPVVRALLTNPSRAVRRHEDKRAKAEARAKLQRWGITGDDLTPARVGKAASTHNRACSCDMCKGGRGQVADKRIEATTELRLSTPTTPVADVTD